MPFKAIKAILLQDNRSTKQHKQPAVPLSRALSRSPLDIPEILERILSYLATSQIRFGPSQVCKSWRLLCLQYISNASTWDSLTTKNSEFVERLKVTDVLYCNFKHCMRGVSNGVGALTDAIRALSPEEQRRLRKLVVVDDNQLYVAFSINIFKPFQSLTCLHVTSDKLFYVSLDGILSFFPNLQDLDVSIKDHRPMEEPALYRTSPSQAWPSTTKNLRSLTFQLMTVDIAFLEDFLKFCPDLKELRLAMIQPRNLIQPSNPGQVEQTSTFNYDYHFSIMSNHCPKLQVFHYSERNAQTKSEQYLMAMWKAFPQLFTWSVLVSNLRGSPDPMAAFPMSLVANFINQLTTLELLAPFGTSREYLSVGFHQLLCAAPSLMHIKAKDIDFDMEATDLDRNTCRDTGHHSVWACRNLRTFHIRVRPEDRFTSSFTADHKNLSSRKFFAYLSRCCPRLQDIHIQYSALMTGLESGFCLLGELRYLERLHLRTISGSNIKQRDFDWLSTKNPRSQPVQERMRRWNIVNGLKDSKLDNQAKRGNRAKGKQVNSNEEEQLSFAIQRASGLRGVAEALEKIREQQWRGEYCWPYLETFRLFSSDLQPMELVKSLRPQLAYQEKFI